MRSLPFIVCLSYGLLLSLSQVFAWGERGHDSIARIAARIAADGSNPAAGSWGKLLAKKEHLLGHLSNTPDIVWRQLGPEVNSLNVPSHFIDLEYVFGPQPTLVDTSNLPVSLADYRQRVQGHCEARRPAMWCAPGKDLGAKLEKAGHAPFRVEALMKALTADLERVKKSEGDPTISDISRHEWVDQALLHAGILAHFVGDLANPHHTSSDHDGWQRDAGGLHAYFESDLVDAQDLSLDQSVWEEARRHQPAQAFWQKGRGDPLRLAWLLALESHSKLDSLAALDKTMARLKDSDAAKHLRAERKPAEQTSSVFRDFIVLRLAVGADVLQNMWTLAWQNAGKPDLTFYRSYHYPVMPAFVPLGYDPLSLK